MTGPKPKSCKMKSILMPSEITIEVFFLIKAGDTLQKVRRTWQRPDPCQHIQTSSRLRSKAELHYVPVHNFFCLINKDFMCSSLSSLATLSYSTTSTCCIRLADSKSPSLLCSTHRPCSVWCQLTSVSQPDAPRRR